MAFLYTDSSSAILLEQSDLFDHLLAHTNVVMSETVYSEITHPGYPGEAQFKAYYHNRLFQVVPAAEWGIEPETEPPLIKENSGLKRWGKGERETICLYLKNRDGVVLIDDGQAARWCSKHEIPFLNALLIPKLFWYSGLISETECILKTDKLSTIGRYSDKVKRFAKACTKEDLSYFIGETINSKKSRD